MAKTKLPKSVLGVKVPKTLRKSQSVKTLLNNPIGREILAGAIVAGATAAATALARKRPSAGQLENAREVVVDAGSRAAVTARDAVEEAASALAGSITSLVTRFQSDESAARKPTKPGKKVSKPPGNKAKKKAASETRANH
jgi:hypothetical protein